MSPTAVNKSPTTIVVYITLDQAGSVMAKSKFSQSRVWDKVADGSTFKTQCRISRGKPACKKPA